MESVHESMMKRSMNFRSALEKEQARLMREREARHRQFQKSLSEPVWYLRSIPYTDYRISNHWKKRSQQYRDSVIDASCETCGMRRIYTEDELFVIDGIPHFHVHHISYNNLGCEEDSDLILVCSACHNAIHYPDSTAAIYWIERNSESHPTLSYQLAQLRPQYQPPRQPET